MRGADQRVVVDDQDSDHVDHGIHPCSTNMEPSLRCSSSPPINSVRSVSPIRPSREPGVGEVPKPSGLRITKSMPCSGSALLCTNTVVPAACLRALSTEERRDGKEWVRKGR